ncbi:5683_t:CDS:2, partial [Racocetra persica]
MDKGKQKAQILEIDESGDHDEDDADELFDELDIVKKKKDTKIVEIESPAVCLVVMEEIPTNKKVLADEKPTIEEQLNKIIDDTNIEEKYKESVKELFKNNKNLFANRLEELGRTNLVKHVIKTQDAEPIKQPPYRLAPNEQDFVHKELEKLKEKGLIKESFSHIVGKDGIQPDKAKVDK